MSQNTIDIIRETRKKIEKLEKDFKRGVPPYQGFTINIGYGGNKPEDIQRVCVGSISDDDNVSKIFYDMILNSLKKSLVYWEKVAEREIKELNECLYTVTNK